MGMAAKTWDGEFWKTGTGGGWSRGRPDHAELNESTPGTGNGGPWM